LVYGYSGPKIDFSKNNIEIIDEIESRLGPISDFEGVFINGKNAVSFIRTISDTNGTKKNFWVSRSYLMPYDNNEYTNLLITGPALVSQDVPDGADERALSRDLQNQVAKINPLINPVILKRWRIFLTIVSGIQFKSYIN